MPISEKEAGQAHMPGKVESTNAYLYHHAATKSQHLAKQGPAKPAQSPQHSQNKGLLTERINTDHLAATGQRRKKNERNTLAQDRPKGGNTPLAQAGKKTLGKASESPKKKKVTASNKYNNSYIPKEFKRSADTKKEASHFLASKASKSDICDADEGQANEGEMGMYKNGLNQISSENIDDVYLQQQHVQTPKKLSDLKKRKINSNKSGDYWASKNQF
jgi:hypothetical protein